jgi:N-acetylmuramoyl-L-alanine amidase
MLLLFLLASSFPIQAKQTQIKGLRIWSAPDHVRLVFDTSAQVVHQIFTLKDPHRLVLDLRYVTLPDDLTDLKKENKIIDGIRSAVRNKNDVRVVFDLKSAVRPKSFSLKPNQKYGHRLVVDLYDGKHAASNRPVKTAKGAQQTGQRDVVIAIDPGHGGEDPGALGKLGTKEKNVVLAISRKLVKELNKQKGIHAILVRDGDYYLGLRKRIDKAREQHADLFVSIHADAFHDTRVRGASVYTLSRSGASDEAARWLAERENSADLMGGVSLEDKDDTLASVLLDLSQIGTLQASSEAASRVLTQLKTLGKTHKRKVQQARFVVLKSPDIPSILVETAFISNPAEERRLRSAKYQGEVATALMKGIKDYFKFQPPPGTWFAANRVPRKHVIASGDTLIAIANRYQVSLKRLRNANGLKGDIIRIGQILEIPGS